MTIPTRLFLVTCIAAIGPAGGLVAQPPRLTVHEAVSRALEHHPSMRSAASALDGARAGLAEAGGTRWPQLRLDASATRFQEPMVVAPLHGFDPQSPPLFDRTLVQASLGASYLLFDGGRRGALVRGEQAGVRGQESAVDATGQALIAEVLDAWLAVSAGRELLAGDDEQVAAIRAEQDRVRQFLDAGRAAPVEALRVAAALAGAEAVRATRAEELSRNELRLARLTGLAAETIRSTPMPGLRPATPRPTADVLRADARLHNPDLARARARMEATEAMTAATGSAWWPELRLVAGYTDYSSGEGRLTGEWHAGIRAGYPLFTGGSRRAATAQAGHQLGAASAELSAAEMRVDDAIDQALALARAAEARGAALQAATDLHEEVARIERLALDEGAGTQTDWLAARAALQASRSALVEARHAEVSARAALARLTGGLTPAALRTLLEEVP